MNAPSSARIRWFAGDYPALQCRRVAFSMDERVRDMERLTIEGLHKLSGAVTVHGAKNSALPILAATLLADGASEITNCP